MTTDEEIVEMINIINKKAKDQKLKVWDREIYQNLGLSYKGKPLTIEQFNEKFKKHREYGVAMLKNATGKFYTYNLNKKYKNSIAEMLDKMGLNYDADKVRNMSYKEFMTLHKQDKWSYVYNRYNQFAEDYELNEQAKSIEIEKKYKNTAKNIHRRMKRVLGY